MQQIIIDVNHVHIAHRNIPVEGFSMPFEMASTEKVGSEVMQAAKDTLYAKGYWAHRDLEISVARGVLRVRGSVPSFYMKQIAVECLKRVPGVLSIIDQISVPDLVHSNRSTANLKTIVSRNQVPFAICSEIVINDQMNQRGIR